MPEGGCTSRRQEWTVSGGIGVFARPYVAEVFGGAKCEN
jgi:hypothetical protein